MALSGGLGPDHEVLQLDLNGGNINLLLSTSTCLPKKESSEIQSPKCDVQCHAESNVGQREIEQPTDCSAATSSEGASAKPNSRWRYASTSSVESVFAAQEQPICDSQFPAKQYRCTRSASSASRDSCFSFRSVIHSRSHMRGSRYSSSSSTTDVVIPLSHQHSRLADEAVHAPRIYRVLSQGQEWTSSHWKRVKFIEEESERSRRCSRISSGFAPIMLFGGLVFICIGISASTNTGKDKVKLKYLSTGPLAVGVFMILLSMLLISLWLYCRSHARDLEHKLIHGSRKNSVDSQNILLSALSRNQGRRPSRRSSFYDNIESRNSADSGSFSIQNRLLSSES